MVGFTFLIPIAISLIGFILAILGLFAGNTPGFMEEYQVILLNTSILGRQYVPALSSSSSSRKKVRGVDLRPFIEVIPRGVGADNATVHSRQLTLAAAEGELAGLTAEQAAVEMAALLGISEFYSLHVIGACEGTFSPNASAVSSWRNVSQCTSGMAPRPLNLSRLIDNELRAAFTGESGLAALGASSSLLAALDRIPTIGMAVAVFYVFGVTGAALGVLLPAAALATRARKPRETVLANLAAVAVAALALLVAGLVVTVGAAAAVSSINRLGADTIGLQASKGTRFASLTWAAFAFMLIDTLYWVNELRTDAIKAAGAAAAAASAKTEAAAA